MDQNQYHFVIMLWMFYLLCSTVQAASVPMPKITLSLTEEPDNVTITAVTEMISSHTTESLHTSSVAEDYVSQVSDIYNKDTQTASDKNVSLISVIYSNDTHTGVSEEPDILTEQTSHHSMMPVKSTTSTSTSVTTSNTAHTSLSSTKYEENITTSSYTEDSTLHYGVSHIYSNDNPSGVTAANETSSAAPVRNQSDNASTESQFVSPSNSTHDTGNNTSSIISTITPSSYMEYNYTRPYIPETTDILLLENFTSNLEKFNTTPTSEMDLSDNGKYNACDVWKDIDISKNQIKISAFFLYIYGMQTSVSLQIYLNARGPFYWDGSALSHAWVSNHI